MTTTTHYKAGAIAFGSIASIGAGYLLLEDVWQSGFTSAHLVSVIVLLLAIGAIHYALSALKRKRWGSGGSLAVLAIGASALVMVGTAGRNADLEIVRLESAKQATGEHAAAVKERDTARIEADAMRKQMATECATGKKTRCDGMRSVTDAYDAKLGVADAKVDRLRPRPVAPGKARALADALQTLGAVASADAAEKVLRTLLPLVFALVLEGSAGAFFLVAFPPIVPAPPANENRPAAANDREEAAPTPEPKPRKRKPVPAADTDGKVVAAEVLALLRSKRQPMTNDEIATALGRHKGTVSKARKALGRQVRTQREGRKVYATAG